MAALPTERTLQRLRKGGWTAGVVERYNPYARKKFDLFGFIDVLAIRDGVDGSFGVQATSGAHTSDRMKKAAEIPHLVTWLNAGNRFEVWGWRKVKLKRGGKAIRWEPRRMLARLEEGKVVYDKL